MRKETHDAMIETALDEIGGLLREHLPTIDKSMQQCLAVSDPEKVFKFNVAIGLVIEPRGSDAAKLTAKISYSVKHSDESTGQIVDPLQVKMVFVKSE